MKNSKLTKSIKIKLRWPTWMELAPAYTIGSLAAFWFIQRTVSF